MKKEINSRIVSKSLQNYLKKGGWNQVYKNKFDENDKIMIIKIILLVKGFSR